jgi:acetolactate synthase I/II/III large subunit
MTEKMNGAESLVRTLVNGGVNVSFANPGTSEMHFVAALDRVEGMRCVLTLFEGVATGAADGYARMAGKPASTLLHLGPGLANGLANLHNAKKASTPMVNIVGDHATYHRDYDAPLTSDIETAAKPFSDWVRTSPNAKRVAEDGAAAVAVAMSPPGKVATLILPGDTAWDEGAGPAKVPEIPIRGRTSEDAVRASANALRSGQPTLLLLTGPALFDKGLELAARISAKTGCKIMVQTFNRRTERGAGRISIERIPYPVDAAVETLKAFKHIVLAGSRVPVGFFAYPDKPSLLAPQDVTFTRLAELEEDIVQALEWLADELGASKMPIALEKYDPPALAKGAIGAAALASSLGALIPENCIVIDESVSTGRSFFPMTKNAHPHTWLQNMGGSIGIGMPMATGAAIACPDRPVLALEGDGSAMYTIQSLWTQARENLNVTTVIFANREYAILRGELVNVGAQNVGRKALDMLDLGRPNMDFVQMASGMGVPAEKVGDMEAFNRAVERGLATPGPYLIEAVI